VSPEECLSRACRWQSWDGNLDLLSGEERDELKELVGSQNLWKVLYVDLQAAADLLAEQYNKLWREEYVGGHLEAQGR
jgi:hypothetical protein